MNVEMSLESIDSTILRIRNLAVSQIVYYANKNKDNVRIDSYQEKEYTKEKYGMKLPLKSAYLKLSSFISIKISGNTDKLEMASFDSMSFQDFLRILKEILNDVVNNRIFVKLNNGTILLNAELKKSGVPEYYSIENNLKKNLIISYIINDNIPFISFSIGDNVECLDLFVFENFYNFLNKIDFYNSSLNLYSIGLNSNKKFFSLSKRDL